MIGKTERRHTRSIKAGNVGIGSDFPISIQSMTNTDTHDHAATLGQVRALEAAGCDIIRLAVPDEAAAEIFSYLKENGVTAPLVADIHFDHKIALRSLEYGADKIRINPGNIGGREKCEAVVSACAERGVPIRIGVNSGSLEKHILEKYSSPTPRALAESALYHAGILDSMGFRNYAISVKSSDVRCMIEANRILASETDVPLHIGVTEAGGTERGTLKSAVGIGTLLAEGIGDTIRVSLTDDPVKEVYAARNILRVLGLRGGLDIISCPTCGRTQIDLIPLLDQFEKRLHESGLGGAEIKVAFMGCAVNGPGEAREADIGIAGGKGEALLFRKGEIIRKIPERRIVDELLEEIKNIIRERGDTVK